MNKRVLWRKTKEHSALSQMRSLILIFNRIGGVMVSVLATSKSWVRVPIRWNERL